MFSAFVRVMQGASHATLHICKYLLRSDLNVGRVAEWIKHRYFAAFQRTQYLSQWFISQAKLLVIVIGMWYLIFINGYINIYNYILTTNVTSNFSSSNPKKFIYLYRKLELSLYGKPLVFDFSQRNLNYSKLCSLYLVPPFI